MQVRLDEIRVRESKVEYRYSWDAALGKFFREDNNLFIECLTDIDLSGVPKSVLAIPFVTNLLALSWIYDIDIVVNELDENFYNSITQIRKGFQSIYPNMVLNGHLICDHLQRNNYEPSKKAVCLFSGGVDATFTFLRHRTEDVTLVNIWGVDIDLNDISGHKEVDEYCKRFANMFNKDYICIKSSVRTFLNESYLNSDVYRLIDDFWWHGAQHSIGMLSVLAPINYVYRNCVNYIASSFTQEDYEEGIKCISYPVVDNSLAIASTECFHDGFETNRIGKIEYICNERKKEQFDLDLKVCFHYENGKNCSSCEKCMRTMAAIMVANDDVSKYGFDSKCNGGKRLRYFLDTNEIRVFNWQMLQDAYKRNPSNKKISWLSDYKFNDLSSFRSRILRLAKKYL